MWTVGQLAAPAGLSVRTLHHWDALGLLTPAERTFSGHRRDWADLIAEAQRLRAAGVESSDEHARAVARRRDALIEAFTGGNPEIRANLQRLYEEQGPERASRGMVDPDLMTWVAAARSA